MEIEKEFSILSKSFLPLGHIEHAAMAMLDFKQSHFWCYPNGRESYLFDLASLTKPLTMGVLYLKDPQLFSSKLVLLLEHRSSLPAWARLSLDNWQEYLMKFSIQESESLYSDLGFLRLMLELEQAGIDWIRELDYLKKMKLFYWNELTSEQKDLCIETGLRERSKIQGQVHDDNAFRLKRKLTHAGLFATIEDLSRALLFLNQTHDMLGKMLFSMKNSPVTKRFHNGFDTVTNKELTLAGDLCSEYTFGHLGFTGTSFWIDAKGEKGAILLTNAVKYAWYDRTTLNYLRKGVGNLVWTANTTEFVAK